MHGYSDMDFEIIKYISGFDIVKEDLVVSKFEKRLPAIKYTLNELTTPVYQVHSSGMRFPVDNSCPLKYIAWSDPETKLELPCTHLEITDYGRTLLYSHLKDERIERKNDFRFWIPILISVFALLRPEIGKLINVVLKLLGR